ncbi:hypothetical protein [Pseudomonas sp. McL0111]|uniref:hypothetical protein n=1 Tax=Pseudomonas sp. McL0111 TaxID=3457357 RepID=UPI00403E8602
MTSRSVTIVTDDLAPPSIAESPGSTVLNPLSVRNNLTMLLSYQGMQDDDEVRVKWIGAPGSGDEGSYTSNFFMLGHVRPVELRIDKELVTFNLGQTVTVTYDLKRGTEPAVTSQPLLLYILPIAQGDLPRPFIAEAADAGEGQMLSLTGLDDFTLRINAWLLGLRGQYLWLRLRGTNADDSAFNVSYWSALDNVIADEFNRFGFYERTYPSSPLQGLKDRSVLNLQLMAGLQKNPDEALAQKFAHRNYIVSTNASTAPLIVSAAGPDGQDIPEGADTRFTDISLCGTARAGEDVEVYDGPTFIQTIRAVSGQWKLPVADLVGGIHVFTARNGGDGSVSKPWMINVVLLNLPLSIKESLDNGHLDPMAARLSLTAVLRYDMQPQDRIRVTWAGAPGTPAGGSHTTNALVAGAVIPREVPLPVSLVAFNLGQMVSITFTYERGLAPPVTSMPFFLRLGTLPASVFVAPVFTQANGTTVLDLSSVTGGATLQFGSWPHIASGQRTWLDLEGINASGEPHNLSIWKGERNSVTRQWALTGLFNQLVSYDYLKLLGDGSTLTVRFRVNLDGVANASTTTPFGPREYTILAGR